MTDEEKSWGALAHLSMLAGLFLPFGNVLGPLAVYLAKKDTMPFVGDQAREEIALIPLRRERTRISDDLYDWAMSWEAWQGLSALR